MAHLPSKKDAAPAVVLRACYAYVRRYTARPNSACNSGKMSASLVERHFIADDQACRVATAQLVEEGVLTPVLVGEKQWPYYALTSTLELLDTPLPTRRVMFLAPLDNMLWDRKGVLLD